MNNAFVITLSIPFLVFVFLPSVWSTSQLPGEENMKCECDIIVRGERYKRVGVGNCHTCSLVAVKYGALTQEMKRNDTFI